MPDPGYHGGVIHPARRSFARLVWGNLTRIISSRSIPQRRPQGAPVGIKSAVFRVRLYQLDRPAENREMSHTDEPDSQPSVQRKPDGQLEPQSGVSAQARGRRWVYPAIIGGCFAIIATVTGFILPCWARNTSMFSLCCSILSFVYPAIFELFRATASPATLIPPAVSRQNMEIEVGENVLILEWIDSK